MNRLRKYLRPALFTLLLAALALAGVLFLPRSLKPYDTENLLRKKPAPYQGMLKVWQVNTWRVGRYSRTGLLTDAARRYEKANIGVFVEIENLTEKQFQDRLAAGDRPDVISYPDGWAGISTDKLLALDAASLPAFERPFRQAFAREPRAAPWMAGGQLVLVNNEVGRAVGIEPPVADNTWTTAALLDYASSAAGGRRRKPALALSGSTPAYLPLALSAANLSSLTAKGLLPEKAFSLDIDHAREMYASGKCALLLCSQWEAALMERLAAKNKAFDYTVLPWPQDSKPCLSVQFVSALDSGDPVKDGAETGLITALLSQKVQTDVAGKACCLPVVPLPESARPKDDLWGMLAAELPVAMAPLPLQARPPETVSAALNGDRTAADQLKELFVN